VQLRFTLPAADGGNGTRTLYATSVEWVEGYLAVVYWRRLGPRYIWCRYWWAHPEAVVRLEAMWRAWEKMRREDPLAGIAKWFVEIGDPMMRELLDPDGPFKGCNETRHREKSEDMSLPTVPLGVLP